MDFGAMIRSKLGETCTLSPQSEDRLDEMLKLINAYAQEKYQEGYHAALADAENLAKRVTVGVTTAN